MIIYPYAFTADQLFFDRRNIGVRAVQILDVAVCKTPKIIRSIGGVRNARPLVKVFLRVIQSPCQIEPCIYPQQVFHFVQQNLFPLLFLDIACPDGIEEEPDDAEENEQVAYGKRYEF